MRIGQTEILRRASQIVKPTDPKAADKALETADETLEKVLQAANSDLKYMTAAAKQLEMIAEQVEENNPQKAESLREKACKITDTFTPDEKDRFFQDICKGWRRENRIDSAWKIIDKIEDENLKDVMRGEILPSLLNKDRIDSAWKVFNQIRDPASIDTARLTALVQK